jgi:hypothetical protein
MEIQRRTRVATEGSSLVCLVCLGRLVVVVGALGHHLCDGTEKRLESVLSQRPCVLAGGGQGGGVDQLMADETIKAVADDEALVVRLAHLAGKSVKLRAHAVFRLRCRSPVHLGFDHLQQQVGS